jgi:hypothetical protein
MMGRMTPCKFCGGQPIQTPSEFTDAFSVECQRCGAVTDRYNDLPRAQDAWTMGDYERYDKPSAGPTP